jgi:aspartyl protease/PDZ domain-containing protein
MSRSIAFAVLLTCSAVHADDLTGLVDRYAAWRGGMAFEHLQSVHLRGSLDTAGLQGTEEIWADRSGRQRLDIDLGVLKQTQVVTPEESWDIAPSGQVETLAQSDGQSITRDQALQFPDVLRGRGGAKATLLAPETREGRSWAVVRVTFGDADNYDVFIDPETGELGGYRILEDRRKRFETFDDWRMVDGVRMSFLQAVKTEAPGGDQTIKVTSLSVNDVIPNDSLARPAPVHKAVFRNGAVSTGWINFDFFRGNRIFFPATVDGHAVTVLLDSGATVSAIDKVFATSIGLQPQGGFTARGTGGIDTTGFVGGVKIQIGNLSIRDVNAAAFDLRPVAQRIGHPIPFVLGDEVFNELAVDIDFAHHRIAFRQPVNLARPADGVEVPLRRVFGNRSVPVSVEGATPVEFEFDLGNGSPLEIYPAYHQTHRLLDARRTSQLLGGGIGGFRTETVVSLHHFSFADVDFVGVPATLTPDTLSGSNSNVVVGNIGLSVLARFRLIIDYSHDRLYAAPQAGAASTPFTRDRLGLALIKQNAGFAVEFVSPGGPAQATGFKTGDKIASIDGKGPGAWSDAALASLRYAPAGTTLTLVMIDGSAKRIKLGDFY